MVTNDLGACEWFVWDLRRSGLIDRGQLDQTVGEFLKRNPRAEAQGLAEFLVQQGTLTAFQADRVLNGKSQGLVLGPYVLQDTIGQGSMGQVYKASSKNDSQMYAVKVLPRRSMWNVRLARRQVRAFGAMNHPAVVPFVDVGTAGGLHYLAWPLVEGETLEAAIRANGRLPADQAAAIGLQVAQGLAVCHQNSIFHGLIKPSNIMLGTDGQARILDFGIGSLLAENEGESLVDTMSTANTLTSGLDCASPESIMEPTNRTPAGDQYSLGCVLYHCVTGRVPFPEGSAVEKMMAHQTKDPTPVQDLAPDCPDGLAGVIAKLMAKAPEGRYEGTEDVAEALQPFVGEYAGVVAASTAAASGRPFRSTGSGSRPGLQAKNGYASGPAPTPPPSAAVLTTPPPAVRFTPPPPAAARPGPVLPGRAAFQPSAADEVPLTPAADYQTSPAALRASAGWLMDDAAPAGAAPQAQPRQMSTVSALAAGGLLMSLVYLGARLLFKLQ
ncbi:MAG: serine/threonine-protein kinase [Gemmataceae bacterium]